jgi:DNA-binding NarL/FixJ family response regulator
VNSHSEHYPSTDTHRGVRTGKTRVVIVDDHPIVRSGYAQLLSLEPDLEVCGEAGSMVDGLQVVDREHPDLVIVDLSLSEGSGLELCKQIKARQNGTKMLVVSMHDESLFAERVLRAGAAGYVNKQEATHTLVEAIRTVMDGRIYLSSQMTDRMLCRAVGSEGFTDESPIHRLSDRELQVLEMIGQGVTTRQIAERLFLSPKTVESYRENLKAKLHLENSAELTRYAVQWVLENQSDTPH